MLCAYTRVDKPPPDPLPPSPITAGMYRRLTMDPNLPPYGPRCPFRPFTFRVTGRNPGRRDGAWYRRGVCEFSAGGEGAAPRGEFILYSLCGAIVTDVVFF